MAFDNGLIIKKPELTPKEIEKCKIARITLQKQTIDKMELAKILGFEGAKSGVERKSREIISMVAQYYPVISLSGDKGYRIAKKDYSEIKDVIDVLHQLKDFGSRIMELEKRCKPLEKYLENYMKQNNITSYAQLENELVKYQ